MYPFLLSLHSLMRWVVLLAAVAAVGAALWGWLGKRSWTALDDRLGLVMTIGFDVQFLVGLILYGVSPLIRTAFADFGAAMGTSALRFFTVEHTFLMIVALIVAHVGRVLIKRVDVAGHKHRRAVIFYGLALVLLLAAIPWYDRPWFRLG